MDNFVRRLLTEWRRLRLPFENETFVVAVSGGADSVALLLALAELRGRNKLRHRFVVSHFNHDLRGRESESDAEFVESLGAAFDFELVVEKGTVRREKNLEQNARRARYEFLVRTAENLRAGGVLTAHTLDDQAETFLINLIRGSGPRGLSGMKPVTFGFKIQDSRSEFPGTNADHQSENADPGFRVNLIRPLLSWARRRETENYCQARKIEYRCDPMNDDPGFRRVRVRKVLLPILAEFNPKIVETLARTATLMGDDSEIRESLTDQEPFAEKEFLELKALRTLLKPKLYQMLRKWLAVNRGNLRGLDLKHIEAIERLISSRGSGRLIELPGGESILKKNGKLFFQRTKVEKRRSAN